MAYLKPSAFTSRFFNALAMRTTVWGVHTLEVEGRQSGEPRRVPVIPVDYAGHRYIVSTRGEAEWVRNMRAAGRVRLGRKGDFTAYQAVEVPVAGRAEIIAAYRKKAGREVNGYWKQLPDDADHPVFQLDPA